jgi:hypothetical protein
MAIAMAMTTQRDRRGSRDPAVDRCDVPDPTIVQVAFLPSTRVVWTRWSKRIASADLAEALPRNLT